MEKDAVLDCLGLYCPMPIVKTAQKIKELEPGQVLEVRVNDPTARLDVEAWSQLTGNPLLAITEEPPNTLRFFVQKKPNA